jgi:hypothetical protein
MVVIGGGSIFKSTNPQITQTYQVGRKPNRSILKSSNQQIHKSPRPIRLEENLIGQSSNPQIFKSTNPQITQTYQVGRKPNRSTCSITKQIIKPPKVDKFPCSPQT